MSQHLSGLPAWLVQRLSALYLALSFIAVMIWWLVISPLNYVKWHALFAHPLAGVACVMFFVALLFHAWVGVRDVILDYLGKTALLRLGMLTLLGGWLIALGIWVMKILLEVMVS